MQHISELADPKVESPEEVVKVGDEIEVKVLRVDVADRKIGLSRIRLTWSKDDLDSDEGEPTPSGLTSPKPRELRGGTGSGIQPAHHHARIVGQEVNWRAEGREPL